MRSLFLKIFLSYWIAQALFLMLAIVVTVAMYPSHEIAAIQAQQPRFLSEAVQAYQGAGEEGARKYLRAVHDGAHVRLFVFDAQGHDLLGRKPPDWIEKVAKGEARTADSFWGRLGPMQFLRESEILADGQRYTLVIELPPQQHTLFGPNGVPGLWVLIGIISSGLVCYVLARYLTSPIVRLRAATQKLAAGDLTARAGVSPSRRHDETAELVRDFDRMAERIESLLTAQGRLLTDISHELRSPLARLNVALELARQRSGPEAQSALERIDREATRLNGLIAELLTIARLEGSENSMPRSPIQLDQLIQ
jgi:two-component system sensor histidine kinase CpxA